MNRWHSPPAELFALVEHTPATILLESSRSSGAHAAPDSAGPPPITRLFTSPLRICIAHSPTDLPQLFEEIESAVAQGLFAAGYFGYECGAFFEPTAAPSPTHPAAVPKQRAAPIAWFGIYGRPFLFDHHAGSFLHGEPATLAQFRSSVDAEGSAALETALAITQAEYARHIAAIQEKIRSGDIYQLNYTVPLRIHSSGSSAALYQALRSRQPAPYGAFLHTRPEHCILSFSPELFFRLENRPHRASVPHPCDVVLSQGWESTTATRRITTRPMKGTAPRGRTTAEDLSLSAWLQQDPKNRAENVMIVDLLRNDLGRIATFGSVHTQDLFAVERYPTLWQMTSTITADLRPQVGFQQIFRALFPCGSITGAPKVRAMQLISELEGQPRGVYTGAIGFFSKEETVFSVAIRTLELHGGSGSMGVGSGIVIDSDPAAEFRECLLKASFLTAQASNSMRPFPSKFSLVETLFWNGEYPIGGFPLLELHLERLADSAGYFAFPFDRAAILAAIDSEVSAFDAQPRKVRLLLNQDGQIQITSELLPEPASNPLRIRIAPQRTDPADRMHFHKTTHRPLYAEAFQAAKEAGYDDVLFLNLREEVTECAIHNIFIEKDGRLLTPPVPCGLLAGVYRRYLLETRAGIEERILCLHDLETADAVYLSNAVRGLQRVTIDSQK